MSLRRTLACAVLLLIFGIRAASAQNSITGKVLDPQGKPVGNTEVILHAVEEKSGNQVDKDTTKADGSFTVQVKTIDPKAVYFVAVVWNGSLYIGDLLRAPFPLQQQYVVTVGVNPVDVTPAAAGAEVTPQDAEHDRTAGTMVIVVALLAIGGVVVFALRRRPPARRRWLVELARLENELEANPEERPALEKRRAELRARLKAAQSS